MILVAVITVWYFIQLLRIVDRCQQDTCIPAIEVINALKKVAGRKDLKKDESFSIVQTQRRGGELGNYVGLARLNLILNVGPESLEQLCDPGVTSFHAFEFGR